MSEVQRKHFTYKLIAKETSPSNQQYELYRNSKTYRGNAYFYKVRFHQNELERSALEELEKEVYRYVRNGWRPICGPTRHFVKKVKYVASYTYSEELDRYVQNFESFDLDCLSQILVFEEDYYLYEERVKREEEEKVRREKEKIEEDQLRQERLVYERQKAEERAQEKRREEEKAALRKAEREKVERWIREREAERLLNKCEFHEVVNWDPRMGKSSSPVPLVNGYRIVEGGTDFVFSGVRVFQFPEDESLLVTKDLPFPSSCPFCKTKLSSYTPYQSVFGHGINLFVEFICCNSKCGSYKYDANLKKHYVDGIEWVPVE